MNIGLITLNGNDNYGNKLQHIAIQKYLTKLGHNTKTIRFLYYNRTEFYCKHVIKYFVNKRYRNFCKFDRKIQYYKRSFFYKNKLSIDPKLENKFDKFLVGSDQVWNSSIKTFNDLYLLSFVSDNSKKVSISASFGVNDIPTKDIGSFKNELCKFSSISVREERGKTLVESLTGRDDVEVLLDPTMWLNSNEWISVIKKPKQIHSKKYILMYFLGEISSDRKKEIERIAEEYNCDIINIMDKKEPYYSYGPSEFLYLEKNAFLICTDSFHSSVFAVLFNRPFIIYNRIQDNIQNTNSRIETLISKLKLENRIYDDICITESNIKHDYSEAYKILEYERKKSYNFIYRSLKNEKDD